MTEKRTFTNDRDYEFIIPLSISRKHDSALEMVNWSQTIFIKPGYRRTRLIHVWSVLILFIILGLTIHITFGEENNDLFGTITIVREPVSAIIIEDGFIPIGETHTFSYRLEKGHKYHMYLSGEWANPVVHATDYDLYLYEYNTYTSTLLSTHTKSAGLLEQVSNDNEGRYFIPEKSGLYYLSVKNDYLESSASETGTLMVIENIETDIWHERWMEGKIEEEPQSTTFWSYEFTSSSPRLKVQIAVPDTLDMYEARLYAMSNPGNGVGELIQNIPVAWEPGLRGDVQGDYGGFNLVPTGFRHVDAMASCERSGEDMIIDYFAPDDGEILYHLALIAEYGIGKLEFIIQTDFIPPEIELLNPPEIANYNEPVLVKFLVNDSQPIQRLDLTYSINNWMTPEKLNPLLTDNGTYLVTFPLTEPGTIVDYSIEAEDIMGNERKIENSYKVMGTSSLEIQYNNQSIIAGETAEITGRLTPKGESVNITISNQKEFYNVEILTDEDGLFSYKFKPTTIGNWTLYANFSGNNAYRPTTIESKTLTVSSYSPSVTLYLNQVRVESGKTITIRGTLDIEQPNIPIEILITHGGNLDKIVTTTDSFGSFSASFTPQIVEYHIIQAIIIGDGFLITDSESAQSDLTVVKPSLFTTLTRIPRIIQEKFALLFKPPFYIGFLSIFGLAIGGIIFYFWRKEGNKLSSRYSHRRRSKL